MKQQKLSEPIEKALAEDIAEGNFNPGDMLPSERELMERFAVGRPSIREALFSLSKRGLIEVGSGRRPRVLEPSFDVVTHELDLIVRQVLNKQSNVANLMELRRVIERALARKLAVEITDAQIEILGAKLQANRDALPDLELFWTTDSDFHASIAAECGNPIFPVIVNALLNWLIIQRRVTLSQPGRPEMALKFHEQIFDAIARHDPDAAEERMNAHLLSVETGVPT